MNGDVYSQSKGRIAVHLTCLLVLRDLRFVFLLVLFFLLIAIFVLYDTRL